MTFRKQFSICHNSLDWMGGFFDLGQEGPDWDGSWHSLRSHPPESCSGILPVVVSLSPNNKRGQTFIYVSPFQASTFVTFANALLAKVRHVARPGFEG